VSDEVEEIIGDEGATNVAAPERIQPVDLQMEMQRSYLDYAMSVIVGRALPDVRDGLKPVHRRVLYAMYDGGYRPTASFSKSSRIVGDVMGTYHPHGDSAIYDALARLVQWWSLRYPLVAGQGNFGTPGNLGPAAPRYTECKMAPLAMEMLRDIDEDSVDFQDNYDGRNQEPVILPSRFPNLLVNGSEGIAVGMATRIPPHNLREVARGAQWYLEHPDASREELLDALIERIPGPDFPTGATILGRRGIEDAYRTGRGRVVMRAKTHFEDMDKAGNRQAIIVDEIPYQVNKAVLTQRFFDSAAVSLKKIYTVAIRELEGWLRSLMTPLESQVREHQAQLRRRMESVQRVMDAGDSLEERLQEIDEARARIERQLAQMKTLVEGVQAAIDRRPGRPNSARRPAAPQRCCRCSDSSTSAGATASHTRSTTSRVSTKSSIVPYQGSGTSSS